MSKTKVREHHAAAVQRLFARNRVSPPASWVTPNARLEGGVLAPEMHLTNQWQLAHEMGRAHLAEAETASPAGVATCGARVEFGDPSQSCYSMGRMIARHQWATPAGEKKKLQGKSGAREEKRDQQAAMERQRAILCYEVTIPRRRVVGHLSHLTAAQMDLNRTVLANHTADLLVQQRGGRWVLQNPHRQQLLRGEPVMTRVMRGEFYESQRAEKTISNYNQASKRHVRVASAINRAMCKT